MVCTGARRFIPTLLARFSRSLRMGHSRLNSGKRHRLVAPLDEIDEQTHCFPAMGAALPCPCWRIPVTVFRRLPEQPVCRAGLTGLLVDEGERIRGLTGNRRRVVSGVADRRRATHELGGRIEPLAESHESAKHKPDVAPKDTTILVDLVDDEFERLEECSPEVVCVTEQVTVEHVGRRQYDRGESSSRARWRSLVDSAPAYWATDTSSNGAANSDSVAS